MLKRISFRCLVGWFAWMLLVAPGAAAERANIVLILADDKDQSVIEGGSKHGKNAAKSDRLAVI